VKTPYVDLLYCELCGRRVAKGGSSLCEACGGSLALTPVEGLADTPSAPPATCWSVGQQLELLGGAYRVGAIRQGGYASVYLADQVKGRGPRE
jgi:hypothetical protein